MSRPYVTIDLEKIEHNARTITRLCGKYGIEVTGVTKVTCGMPQVGKALLRGGVTSIGESRMENILRLKANGVNAPYMLLRIPPLSAVEDIVTSVDISLNSELNVISALSGAAHRRGLVHKIIIMVDLGDLREGVWPDDLLPLVGRVVDLPGIRIVGLGTNLSCYGGVVPSEQNMDRLVEYARKVEGHFGIRLQYVSGGNSSSLNLIASGRMPKGINHVRIGEGILLGRETVSRTAWPGTYQDAFVLNAEVIELKEKPSVPIGETGEDAFGRKPVFEDRGDMFRAILNIGREDVDVEGISPEDSRLSILGASSDHLLVDASGARDEIRLGDDLRFHLSYSALLAAMTSMYVEKQPLREGIVEQPHKGIVLIGVPSAMHYRSPSVVKKLVRGYPGIRPYVPGSINIWSPSPGMTATLIPGLEKLGFPLIDKGDLNLPFLKKQVAKASSLFEERKDLVIKIAEKTAEEVEKAVSEDYIPVVISSHPANSLGVYLGLSRLPGPPGLIVFSAHAGLQVPTEERRERISRMVLAAALGYGDVDLAGCGGIKPKLEPENVVLVGLRDVGEEEVKLITRSRIKAFTMEDIDALGMREVSYRALRTAGMGKSGLHVTLDLSVLDPTVTPGILKPVNGGISYREVHLAMEMIAMSGLLRSLDVVGFSPERDPEWVTARITSEFILSLFGKKILGI